MEKSNQKRIVDNLTIFMRYVSSVSCSIFFSSTFIFIKYTEYNKTNGSNFLYLACIFPTLINYLLKIVLTMKISKFNQKESFIPILSLLCGLILIIFLHFENFILANLIYFGIIALCMFNFITTFYFITHESFLSISYENNFNSFRNRIYKIIVEEIPTYGLAYYISVFKEKGLKPYLVLITFIFLINTFLIGVYNLKYLESDTKPKIMLKEPKVLTKGTVIVIFLLKILGEFNETYLYSSLTRKLKDNGHLIYFFSVQFLFKLGYKKIQNTNLIKFSLLKVLLYVSSLLVGSNLCLLNRRILSFIVFSVNGITNQIVFATYDYLIENEFLINFGELLVFLLITFYLLFCKLIYNNELLCDIIFMSNVRL